MIADLTALARESIARLGGRAPLWQIAEDVYQQLDSEDIREIADGALRHRLREALRTVGDDGLPGAVSVGDVYVQTVLLDVDEYRVVIKGYLKRAHANTARARRFDAECVAVHGVSPLAEFRREAS